jgi:hypothetical protein
MLLTHSSPFGKDSRVRILKQHLAESDTVTAQDAWRFIYRELLWIDGSTGLAHLYESDKAQPGRPWYDRSVVFTDMLCDRFDGISREDLKLHIDRLFRACLEILIQGHGTEEQDEDLAETLTSLQTVRSESSGLKSQSTFDDERDVLAYTPDVSLVMEFAALLQQHAKIPALEAESFARELVARARLYFTVERKRQNVLGEGFEDLLQLLVAKIGRVPDKYIRVRQRVNHLPGFQNANTTRERIEAPDLAIVKDERTELLASVKWSLRHDRQKQLSDELDCYADLLSQQTFPRYVLITNEYDPGRLVNTDGLSRRGQRVDCIYHVNLELLMGALHDHERIKDIRPLIVTGRLRSIADFFKDMSEDYAS